MKYIKLFEELNRITVTPEEKVKLKEITKRWLSLLNDTKTGILEKKTLEYGLGDISRLITMDGSYYIKSNGYKLVDEVAKKLSVGRGVSIIFDRKKNCFTTSSGKALVTFNMVSDIKQIEFPKKEVEGFAFYTNWKTSIYINHKTGDVFNDPYNKINWDKYTKDSANFIKVWDFTGGNIVLPVDKNRVHKKDGLFMDIFSFVYHEFIHSKDPLCLMPAKQQEAQTGIKYSTPDMQASGTKGMYAGHPKELQTIGNNLLEIVGYYFERTLRGDTDGGGLNYGLTKDYVMNYFIPVIKEVKDFIKGDRYDLSEMARKQLSGTNKHDAALRSYVIQLNIGRKENPSGFKYVQEWMRADFIKFIEMYNKKVTEINKKKSVNELGWKASVDGIPTLTPAKS